MLLSFLLLVPIIGIFFIAGTISYEHGVVKTTYYKNIALITSIINLIISLIVYILFDSNTNQFQFVQEHYNLNYFDIYLGVDGISIYFVLLTTIIMPIAILSNWNSITENVKSYLIIMLLLETLLLAIFLVLDILLFYVFFESTLPPLFLLIGLFGSSNKVRASFYIFLYTFILKCKRAKHRGSPKALVTKVLKEISKLAWLMTQGMVRSLVFFIEKLFIITDIWVIAVLNHPFFYLKDVKEQRVDGSSISRSLDIVRCTLVAGKPVLRRKFYIDSNESIITNKRFLSSKSSINPWFITGLTEAEGCFMLGFFKTDMYKMGYQIQSIFKITLHKKDQDLLYEVRDYFGVGTVTNHGNTTLQYTVKSLKGLEKVIYHFDKFSLLSQKWADYTLLKNAITLIKNKEHLTTEGFKKVLSIRAAMNLGLSDELNLSFPNVIPFSRPSQQKLNNLNYNYIAGLTSGDGCFYVSIRKSSNTKLGKSVTLKFHIVQHSRDIELIKMLISTLNCGRIELNLKQSAVYFVVTSFEDIIEKIIPLFDKHPIKGIKSLDYADFKSIANLMNNKEHLTEEGLSKIQSLKLNMNLFRKL